MRCDEIGVRVNREVLTDFLNGVRPGQFFHVRGYVNEHKEKADHFLRFGVKYMGLKARDVALMRAVLAGEKTFDVHVEHGVWIPNELLSSDTLFSHVNADSVLTHVTHDIHVGADLSNATIRVTKTGYADLLDVIKFSSRKAADKTKATLSYDLPSTHPLVKAAIGGCDLTGTILNGLTAPRSFPTNYEKEAQSCFSMVKDGVVRWYIRDVLFVSKVIRKEGTYPFSASTPLSAVKDVIRTNHLMTGKYRQFILTDGQFEAVTIEGQAIMCDGVDEEFYFALPEAVKQAVSQVVA